jgi:hypothetical protein
MADGGDGSGRLSEVDREIEELRRSISRAPVHGALYYLMLVAIFFVGFAIGYATHSLVGASIILLGLALVAWREITGFKARTVVLTHVLGEKLVERRELAERHEIEAGGKQLER